MGFYLWGSQCRRMCLKQRIIGLIYVLQSLGNILTTMSILAIPIVLWSGQPMVAYSRKEDLQLLLRLAFALVASKLLDDCIVALVVGYNTAVSEGLPALWISPCKYYSSYLRRRLTLCRSYSCSLEGFSRQMRLRHTIPVPCNRTQRRLDQRPERWQGFASIKTLHRSVVK